MARIQELTLGGNNRALLLIALIAGLVAAAVVFVAVSSSSDDDDATAAVSSEATSIVVAAQAISPGTEITEDMLKVVEVPNDLVIAGTYDDVELVVGDSARVAIAEGEQINSTKVGLVVPDGLNGVVPKDLRAVAVDINEITAVGGLLLPGDRVDILAAYYIDEMPGLPEGLDVLRTETILQNVEVLSVAQEAQEPSAGASDREDAGANDSITSGQVSDDVEEQPTAGTITVALTPAQVQILVAKQEHAKRVWADLRGFGDQIAVDLAPTDIFVREDREDRIVIR